MKWEGIEFPSIDIKKFIEVLKKDKKNINSNIMCVLTKGIGNMFLEEIDGDAMFGYLTNYLENK